MTEVSEYLISKGVTTYRANGDEVTAHCWFCPDGDPKGKGKLYINLVEGLHNCKRCDVTGNFKTLMRSLGDEPTVEYIPGSDPGARRRVLEAAKDFYVEQLQNRDDVLEWLIGKGEHPAWGTRRALSPETVVDMGLGFASRTWSAVQHLRDNGHKMADIRAAGLTTEGGDDFHQNKLIIPYLSRGSVLQIRGKELGGKYFTGPGDNVRLYGIDTLADADEVVVVEGEFDQMLLWQHLQLSPEARHRAFAVVGLAGANALPHNFASYFTTARKVYLALDPDDTGRKAAVKIKEELGSKARIVEMPEELPKCDWTELFSNRGGTYRDAMRLIGNAAGKRIFSVADAGERWRRQDTSPTIKTGFTDIDIITGGFRPGQLIVPLAKTGAGKTIMLCNIAYNQRALPSLFISLEQTQEEVYERLRRIHFFYNPYDSERQVEDALSKLRIVDENRLREGEIAELCDEYQEDTGEAVRVVHVDYLGYYAKGARGTGNYEKTGNAVMELKAEAKSRRVVLFSPHQVNRGAEAGKPIDLDDARDSGAVEETADFLISVYRPDDALKNGSSTGVVRGEMLKSRHGGKSKQYSLLASPASLVMCDSGGRNARKVQAEIDAVARGLTWKDIREQQSKRQMQLAV